LPADVAVAEPAGSPVTVTCYNLPASPNTPPGHFYVIQIAGHKIIETGVLSGGCPASKQ
jgi:hypothetical protein